MKQQEERRGRVHNFNAGPTAIPLEVLERAQAEFTLYPNAGMSVMEMSHRGAAFQEIIDRARATISELYQLPETHEVLFLQGGASLQFAMLPLNLGDGGAYINTGTWSTRAIKEAQVIGAAHEVWSNEEERFCAVPQKSIAVPRDARYLHYTSNNTIYGTQYHQLPLIHWEEEGGERERGGERGGERGREEQRAQLPLVADLSSDFLSRPLDVSPFDVIYAGAQKNAGPAGVTILLVNREVSRAAPKTERCPTILQYRTHAQKGSMYNTPNTFGIYLLGCVAEWVLQRGGLSAMANYNKQKALSIYQLIDTYPDIFSGHAHTHSRSHMNITFRLKDPSREGELFEFAEREQIVGLKGHRSVGGLRASIYNAVSQESVELLVDMLERFATR